jgi:hypothetical protein
LEKERISTFRLHDATLYVLPEVLNMLLEPRAPGTPLLSHVVTRAVL